MTRSSSEADDTPTLREGVMRVLAGIEEPIGLADIASVLRMTAKEDRADLAKVLHRLKTEGAIIGGLPGGKGRRFRYRIAAEGEHPADLPKAPRSGPAKRRRAVSRKPAAAGVPKIRHAEPLHDACEAMETALAAMVKDLAVMAAVRAYGALREAIARYKPCRSPPSNSSRTFAGSTTGHC